MKNVKENDTKVLKSKRFVVRMSLVGKNQVIEFTNKKGKTYTYNHDKVYEIMKSKLTTLPCWTKYKSYTATNNIPMVCRDKELVQLVGQVGKTLERVFPLPFIIRNNMCKIEKIINTIYITGGLILIIIVVMATSSCGTSKKCNNKFINENRNW